MLAHCCSGHRRGRINPTARCTSLAMSLLERDEGRRERRRLSREVHKTTRRYPVASSKGGSRRSQSSPPNGRIPSRAVHGRPKEPGEYDVVTSIPRPGAIDECAITSTNRLLMALSSQLDWSRHEDKRTGCLLIVCPGWRAGIEIVSLLPPGDECKHRKDASI